MTSKFAESFDSVEAGLLQIFKSSLRFYQNGGSFHVRLKDGIVYIKRKNRRKWDELVSVREAEKMNCSEREQLIRRVMNGDRAEKASKNDSVPSD